jgi:hypothetical protein
MERAQAHLQEEQNFNQATQEEGSVMALTRTLSGQYVIKSKAQAKSALALMQELKDEISALSKEHGIDEMMQDAVELKKAVEGFMIEKDIDEIQIDNESYGKLIKGGYDRHWVLLDSEIPEDAPGVKSLRSILKKKYKGQPAQFKEVMRRITKRIPDAEKIEEAVSDGTLRESEIAPAFVEKEKKPYLRVF